MNFVKSQGLSVEIRRYNDREERLLLNNENQEVKESDEINEIVNSKLYDGVLTEAAVEAFIRKCLIKPPKKCKNNFKNYKLLVAYIKSLFRNDDRELNNIAKKDKKFKENEKILYTPYVMQRANLKAKLDEIVKNGKFKNENDKEEFIRKYIENPITQITTSLISGNKVNDRYTSRRYYAEITEELKKQSKYSIGLWYKRGSYIDRQLNLLCIECIVHKLNNTKGKVTKRIVKDVINQSLHDIHFFNYKDKNEIVTEKQRYEAYDIIKELNIYLNKAIKSTKGKINTNKFNQKHFINYYKHSQRNKLNSYLLSEGKRKIFCPSNSNNSKEYIEKNQYDLFKMNHIVINKALDLFTDAEMALKSITSNKFYQYKDIFYTSEIDRYIDEEGMKRLCKKKINYKFEFEYEKNTLQNYISNLKEIRNDLFHAKTKINDVVSINFHNKKNNSTLVKFYNENLLYFLSEKYIGTKISLCLNKNSLEKVISRSIENMIETTNYKHLSVNKLFENKIIKIMGWNLDKIKNLEELTELKHAQKNVIRLIYKNIFLVNEDLNETLIKIHNNNNSGKNLDKNKDYMSQVQQQISIMENEKQFKEVKELKKMLRETYTSAFIDFLNKNKNLYEFENNYIQKDTYQEQTANIKTILDSTEYKPNVQPKFENWLFLFSLATTIQLSEFKGDLIKHANLIDKNCTTKNSKDIETIKELIRLTSIVLLVKNSKYQMHETTNLAHIYPKKDIENLYQKIFKGKVKEINDILSKRNFDDYYMQSDKSTYVYRKSLITIMDTINDFRQYEIFFKNSLKINEKLIPNSKLTSDFHKDFNQLKEEYFSGKKEKVDNPKIKKFYEAEENMIEYNQKMRILSLNYHLDILNIQREIQSRLIGLMRNRELDMLFITRALTNHNKFAIVNGYEEGEPVKKEYNFTKILKVKIYRLEDSIKESDNKVLKEILFNMNTKNTRDKIDHYSLFIANKNEEEEEKELPYLNNKEGLIKEIKGLFRYDLKKQKSIETIIESIFEKYGYFVTFDPKNGNLIEKTDKKGNIQYKYIDRGGKRINLTSENEQKNIVEIFKGIKVYLK